MYRALTALPGETAPNVGPEPPGWVQIQAGHELAKIVSLARFTPGQASGFNWSQFEAEQQLWRWYLKWRVVEAPQPPVPAPPERERAR